MVVLRFVYYAICYLLRSFALHYGLASFEMKTLAKSLAVYASVYYIGHLVVVFVFVLDFLVPKPRGPKKEQ